MPLVAREFERAFADEIYKHRLERVKERMEEEDLDVLLLSEPTNQHYLTGYESESWFTFQMAIVFRDEPQPVFTARNMEIRAAEITTWMDNEYVQCYTDDYAPNSLYHPAEWVVNLVEEYGYDDRSIGVEKSSKHLSIDAYDKLRAELPEAEFSDASLLVNQLYLKKTEEELDYMRKAARITDKAMQRAEGIIAEGVRENDAAAEIYKALVTGTEEYGGDKPGSTPAFGPFHYRFGEREFSQGDIFGLEFSGSVRKFHSPLCRTFSVGEPAEEHQELWNQLDEDLQLILDTVEPGRTCEEVERIYRENANIPKASRSGYATGFGVESWSEGSSSFTEGDETVLEPGMTFHSNPSIDTLNYEGGVGEEMFRMLHSETYVVTEDGCEVFGEYPRKLVVV